MILSQEYPMKNIDWIFGKIEPQEKIKSELNYENQ